MYFVVNGLRFRSVKYKTKLSLKEMTAELPSLMCKLTLTLILKQQWHHFFNASVKTFLPVIDVAIPWINAI